MPKKPPQNRDQWVQLRVLPEEKNLWARAASRMGLPVSQWMRLMANRVARRELGEDLVGEAERSSAEETPV